MKDKSIKAAVITGVAVLVFAAASKMPLQPGINGNKNAGDISWSSSSVVARVLASSTAMDSSINLPNRPFLLVSVR